MPNYDPKNLSAPIPPQHPWSPTSAPVDSRVIHQTRTFHRLTLTEAHVRELVVAHFASLGYFPGVPVEKLRIEWSFSEPVEFSIVTESEWEDAP